ncbi:MAG: hypothetical protein PHT34_05285 [Oscillospiraceae bacterium]|nr:hypothetical protein [Oscillospiraceae bacterium]
MDTGLPKYNHIFLMKLSFCLKKNLHLLLGVAAWAAYIILFFILKQNIEPKYFIHCRLDDYIPFLKWFYLPYVFWYVYLFVTLLYFGITDKMHYIRMQVHIFMGLIVCFCVFLLYPNAIDFRPVITEQDFLSRMISAMFAIDKSTMVTPSMHVFCALCLHMGIANGPRTRNHKRLVLSSFIVMVLICSSTVLIKQHSIIDIFWGVVLAVLLYFPVYRRKQKPKNESSL